MKSKKFIISALFSACCASISAQQLQATRSHYSTEDGLTSNAISFITQDDYGYIWLGTWNGISRFDGYDFYNYATGAASHIPNLHNRVLDLALDNLQNVWMRMYDGRIFLIRRSDDRMINPFEKISGSEEYRTSHPIIVTTSGDVLAGIDDVGLYKMRMERNNVESQLITTGGMTITSMAEGYQSDIWLGTDQGVHRMDASNLTIERKGMFLDEYITCLYSNGYNIYGSTRSGMIFSFAYGKEPEVIRQTGLPINSLFVDSHGLIWFSDSRQGVVMLNPETGQERLIEQEVTTPDYDGQGGVFNEVNGIVWMRMNHGGYGYYDREKDEVEYFHNDPSNPWNLSNTVNASLELPEGVIWETTNRRGLEKLEIMKNTIQRTLLIPNATSMLENEIRALYYDNERHLTLIGNKANCVFVYDDHGTLVNTITHDDTGHPIGRSYGISKDSKGNYWLASKDYGLFRITPKAGGYSVVNFHHDDNDPYTLSSNSAYATVEDAQGNIWVATYGGGVNVLAKNRKGETVFLHSQNDMTAYPYNSHQKIRTISLGPDGRVWAGSTDGIIILSYKDGGVEIEKLQPSAVEPDKFLQSSDVVCMGRDAKGDMWIGTNGGGISHSIGYDSKGKLLWENFGAKEGLPSEEIKSLTFDDRNNVWFAADHIICSYDSDKQIFTVFSSLDGVDETLTSEGGAITQGNGNILFGTLNGYYTIDRKKLVNPTGSMLKLQITDFWLNDELQSPRLNKNFDFYVPGSRSITLNSHSDMLAFRFASLNYQLQHRVHYQYKLEGYDKQWYNAPRDRIVRYADLPTGTYTLRIKAFLLESPEKFDMRELEIVVKPYFLLSYGAIWVYMLLGAAGVIGLMLWWQNRLYRKYHPEAAVKKEEPEAPVEEPQEEQEATYDYEIIEEE